MGIEPTHPAWEAGILTVVLYPRDDRFQLPCWLGHGGICAVSRCGVRRAVFRSYTEAELYAARAVQFPPPFAPGIVILCEETAFFSHLPGATRLSGSPGTRTQDLPVMSRGL